MGNEFRQTGFQYLETGSGWMYGPNLSLIITDDLSLSVSYQYGKLYVDYDKKWSHENSQYNYAGNIKATRHDIDTAISYSIIPMFKVFVGYKYQPVEMILKKSGTVMDSSDPDSDRFVDEEAEIDLKFHCPAAGVGVSLPFGGVFAFTANFSMLYSMGSGEVSITEVKYFANTTNGNFTDGQKEPYAPIDIEYKGYGFNAEPAIVCFVKKDILIVLGFRYQLLILETTFENEYVGKRTIKDMDDHLYGGYLTVLYKF